MKLIVANWKANGDMESIKDWCRDVAAGFINLRNEDPTVHFCVCPPYIYTSHFLWGELDDLVAATNSNFYLGAQDVSPYGLGAHTGEIPAEMLAEFSCRYVLIGHSERRQELQEDNALLKAKLKSALAAGLIPIFCIGESAAQREAGKTQAVLKEQLQPILELPDTALPIIAYEPVWAIGSGVAASVKQVAQTHRMIANLLPGKLDVPILYGGSVKPQNAADFLRLDVVDGLLVGGASLDAAAILAIIQANQQAAES